MSTVIPTTTLLSLRDFWLDGCPLTPGVPAKEVMERWFKPNPAFDAELKKRYGEAVEKASQSTASELMKQISNAEEAQGLLLLLDQVPRNIYRGEEASKAYTKTDPLAEELVQQFIAPPLEYHNAHNWSELPFLQVWFVLPLMHSEKMEVHDKMHKLLESMPSCKWEVNEGQKKYLEQFAHKHTAVLKRFGHYPSRNAALGRESTKEEEEFLKDGPGW